MAPQVARDCACLCLLPSICLLATASASYSPGEELSSLSILRLAELNAILCGVEFGLPLRVRVQTLVVTIALDLILYVGLRVAGNCGSSVGYLPKCFALRVEAES